MTRRHPLVYLFLFVFGCAMIGTVVGVIVGHILRDAVQSIEGRVKSLEEWRWSPRTIEYDGGMR